VIAFTDITGLAGLALGGAVVVSPALKRLGIRGSAPALAGLFVLMLLPLPGGLPLAGYLRGALGDTSVRSSATLLTELRYSLIRDLLKVSVFDAASVFGRIRDRATHDEAAQGAVAVGLGLHGLVFTVLSVDLYASFGWTTDGRFSPGLSLEVHEAYH